MSFQKDVSWVNIVVETACAVDLLNSLGHLSCSISHLVLRQIHHSVLCEVSLKVTSSRVREGNVDKVALLERLNVFGYISMALKALMQSYFWEHAQIVKLHVLVNDFDENFRSSQLVLGLEGH